MVSWGIQTICYYDHWVQIAFDSRRRTHSSTSHDFSNWFKKRNVQRAFSDIAAANAALFFLMNVPQKTISLQVRQKWRDCFYHGKREKNSSKGGKAANAARKTITWSSYHGNLTTVCLSFLLLLEKTKEARAISTPWLCFGTFDV